MAADTSVLQRLTALDTCVVSDALDARGLEGVLDGLRRQAGTGTLVGPAVTVELVPLGGAGTGPRHHLGARAMDHAVPGSVVVVANAARMDSAAWGGLLSRAAVRRRIAGIVVDGLVRDLDQIGALRLTLFGRGVTPVTARGRVTESAFDRPIRIGRVTVVPGDWVIADGSGVVIVPARHVVSVLDTAESIAAAEHHMAAAIDRGRPVSEVLAERYEHLVADGRRG